jgi:hypothetical protein
MQCESLCCLWKRYVMATNDCKQRKGTRTTGSSLPLHREELRSIAAANTPVAIAWADRVTTRSRSAAVGGTNAEPAVTHLVIMHAGIVGVG